MEANDDYLGLEKIIPYRCGIKIDDEALIGYKVLGLRADFLRNQGQGLKDFIIWNSARLKWDSDVTETATLNGSSLEGYFKTPITLDEDGLFLGYGFTVDYLTTATAYPIAYGTPAGTRNSCFISTGPDYGSKFIDYANDAGPLMITVFLEAPDDIPPALALKSVIGRPRAYTGQTFQLAFKAMNLGTAEITSLKYSYTLDGQTKSAVKNFSPALPPVIGRQQQVTLSFDPVNAVGSHPMQVTFDEINGKANPATEKTVKFDLAVSDAGINFDPAKVAKYHFCDKTVGTMGAKAKTVYDVAVNANLPALKGLKVIGAKVDGLLEENMGSFTIWSSKALGDNPDLEEVDVDLAGNEIIGGFHNPPVIDGSDLYIGYSMEVMHLNIPTQTPVPYGAPVGVPGSFFLKTNEVSWNDFSENYGSATITLFLDGDIPQDAAALTLMQSSNVLYKDRNFTLKFEFANAGINPISDIDYSYRLGDKTVSGSQHLQTQVPAQLGATGEFSIDMDPITTGGVYDLDLTLTKVNGKENISPSRQKQFRLVIPSFYPVKRPLFEEATGTWCGWCPRGMVGMRELAKEFPEFIGAAYHNNDPMMVTEDYPWAMDGYPSGSIDRQKHIDPFYGSSAEDPAGLKDMGVRDDYLAACGHDAPANIGLETSWNADKSRLTATANVVFAYADDNEAYRLGFLLLKDGYSNSQEKAWWQSNSYGGLTTAGLLSELNSHPNPDPDYVYNDVVIEAKTNRGIGDVFPKEIIPNQTYSYSYEFDTSSIRSINPGNEDTELLPDKDNLTVIAMLLNRNARVLNARKVAAGEAVSISETSLSVSENTQPIYYDLTGRQVLNPSNGIFIKKQGSKAHKIILK